MLVGLAAAAVLLAWLIGRLVSDRYLWSQWLLWIPTPVALLATLVGLGTALRPAPRRGPRLICWAVALIVVAGYFALGEHRLLRRPPAASDGIRLLHWNATHTPREPVEPMAERLVALDPDIAILTHAGRVPWTPTVRRWLGPTSRPFQIGVFTIVSRFPILQARWIAATPEMNIALLRIDARSADLGEPVIYMLDLPSDPRVSRLELAKIARRLIDESGAPPPDLVVGDLNMTRGSASIRLLFPGMRHAYDEAGHGYGASFRRDLPMYHIDHVLLGEAFDALDYTLVDPGMTRHYIQTTQVAGRKRAARPRGS